MLKKKTIHNEVDGKGAITFTLEEKGTIKR